MTLFNAGKLTILISMVIMYMEPLLMVSDSLTFLINQKKIIRLINRMEKVNDKLNRVNIYVNLAKVRRLSIVFVSTITILEIGLVTYNYVVFEDAIWFIPIYVSTVAKVFYISLVFITKKYFQGINDQLESTKQFFEQKKLLKKKRLKNVKESDDFGYLHKEILYKRTIAGICKELASDGTDKVVNVIPYGDNG